MMSLPKIYTHLHIGGSYDGEVIECEKEREFHVLPKKVKKSEFVDEASIYFTEEYQKMRFRASNKVYIFEVYLGLSDSDVIDKFIDRYKRTEKE